MVDQPQTKHPCQMSQRLLKATRERPTMPPAPSEALLDAMQYAREHPPAPSKALLDAIQKAREHPQEVARRLSNNTLESSRDPDALAKRSAEMGKSLQARRAQGPKPYKAMTEVALEMGLSEKFGSPEDGEILSDTNTSSSDAVVTPSTEHAVLNSPGTKARVGAKGQIKRLTQATKRANQDSLGRKKPAKTGRSSSASSIASPMEADSPPIVAESSASGAVRETLNAASHTPANPGPLKTPPDAQTYGFPVQPSMPAWYGSVNQSSLKLLERKRPQELAAIDALKACIIRCKQETSTARLQKEYNDLRDHIHKAESKLILDGIKIRSTRILTDSGLPRIFNERAKFPWDLKADAWHLYEKWMNGDFEHDILRGIVTVKGKDRNGDRLNAAYRAKHPRDPKAFGDNGAVLGQWWPSQLCAVRDGIHGAAQGGIYGDKEQGAYSIILSSGGYHDKDLGDIIEYSGTEGSNFEIKAATQSMITSAKLGNHIRVLRSSQLPKSNKYRPEVGLRYDGLYQIKSYQEIDVEKQDYLFHLERIPGQQPIRYEGPAKRPTVFEVQAYDRCKGRI